MSSLLLLSIAARWEVIFASLLLMILLPIASFLAGAWKQPRARAPALSRTRKPPRARAAA